jgi:hypothetical protein
MAPVLVFTLSILASVVTSVLLKGRFAPCTRLAIAVPQRIYVWLTFDFDEMRKVCPAQEIPGARATRQKLPQAGRICRHSRQDLPLILGKSRRRRACGAASW